MGELVDDAIVDVENIFRRLKENHNPRPAATPSRYLALCLRGQQRNSLCNRLRHRCRYSRRSATICACQVCEGRLFAPLGMAYIVSILASLLVSLTVTPVLSYYLLPQSKATHGEKDGLLASSLLKRGAGYLIRFSMARPGSLLMFAWLMVALCIWMAVDTAGWRLPCPSSMKAVCRLM